MRNRPDSRGRLAGLTPAGSPRPLPGGDPPVDDEADWPRPAARGDGVRPRYTGGWVPDEVEVPDESEPLDETEPPDEAEPLRDAEPLDEADRLRDADPPDEGIGPPHPAGPAPSPDSLPDHRAGRVRYRPHQAWGRIAQRWVPEPLREARVDPGRRGALLLTVVAAVAALVAAVGVWRDQPQPRPLQAVSLAQVSGALPASGTTTTTGRTSPLRGATATRETSTGGGAAGNGSVGTETTAVEVLIVSVTGAVRHPGLVRLPPGSRVADAIAKAGGAIGAADLTGVNLAARLVDGASVVVSDQPTGGNGSSVSGGGSNAGSGSAGTDAGSGSGTGSDGSAAITRAGQPVGKVDLNSADAATLDALPGVGPVTAAAIVAWRDKNGNYTSVDQLQEIQGIGPARFAALAPLVTV